MALDKFLETIQEGVLHSLADIKKVKKKNHRD